MGYVGHGWLPGRSSPGCGMISSWVIERAPWRMDVPRHVIALAAGGLPLVMTKDGTIWGWGWNAGGSLGTGTNSRTSPERVRHLSRIVTVSAGQFFSLALREDGTVWGWGDNRFAQLNPRLPELSATPAQVMDLPKAVAIATLSKHLKFHHYDFVVI